MQKFFLTVKDCAIIVLRKGRHAIGLVLLVVMLNHFQIFEVELVGLIALWTAALVFVAGLPLSALVRLDALETSWGISEPDKAIALGLAIAIINWMLIVLLGRGVRWIFRSVDRALPEPPSSKKDPDEESWSL